MLKGRENVIKRTKERKKEGKKKLDMKEKEKK